MRVVKNNCTRDEYLAYDDASSEKYQFYDGEIFAMSGGSFNHSRISTNAIFQLQNRLSKTPCETMNSDMRITTPSGLNTYPDVSVFCGDPELIGNTILYSILR